MSHFYNSFSNFQQTKHAEFNLSIVFLAMMVGLSNLFLYCFFGKVATESYSKMADCLFKPNWYALPVDLQKYFILMIGNTHIPLQYNGLGLMVLDLETFCFVSNEKNVLLDTILLKFFSTNYRYS